MTLPFDVRPVAPAHAREVGLLVSPRYLARVRAAAPFAILGYGELTALPGLEDRWRFGEDPPPLPRAIREAVPRPATGLDLVFQGWSRAEAAVVVPLEGVDVEALAAALDRRYLWLVDAGGALSVVDRLEGTRTALCAFDDRVGPAIFEDLARDIDDDTPKLGASNGERGFLVDVAFVPGDVDGVAMSDLRLTRVPDPTPGAGWRLNPRRLEALVDQARQMAQRHGWHFQVILGEDLRLAVTPDGSVRPIREDQCLAARLRRALGERQPVTASGPTRQRETRLPN